MDSWYECESGVVFLLSAFVSKGDVFCAVYLR
jgi:hypothetical protein